MLLSENWKRVTIEGVVEEYYVSDKGNVKNSKGELLNKRLIGHGYYGVSLKNKKMKRNISYLVHRLVAHEFIPNPNNYPQVNHIDGNKINNCVENLEWCTCKMNMEHAIRTGLLNDETWKKIHEATRKKVDMYDVDMNYLATFSSITLASQLTGVAGDKITRSCQNNRITKQGYRFRYHQENEVAQ